VESAASHGETAIRMCWRRGSSKKHLDGLKLKELLLSLGIMDKVR